MLVKDHKELDKDGLWLVRLVIPAKNYTQCFAKMGYKIIKKSFDFHKVDYMKYTIKQAKCLKLDLERIGRRETIEMDKDLIVKLDIEAMYPSITYELVAEAVRYYAEGFSEEETARVEAGLDMLKFSMSNCLINFREKYLQYGKERDPLKRVLTIGGYDSAWLADLTACYILERAEPVWSEQFAYFKIYRDD